MPSGKKERKEGRKEWGRERGREILGKKKKKEGKILSAVSFWLGRSLVQFHPVDGKKCFSHFSPGRKTGDQHSPFILRLKFTWWKSSLWIRNRNKEFWCKESLRDLCREQSGGELSGPRNGQVGDRKHFPRAGMKSETELFSRASTLLIRTPLIWILRKSLSFFFFFFTGFSQHSPLWIYKELLKYYLIDDYPCKNMIGFSRWASEMLIKKKKKSHLRVLWTHLIPDDKNSHSIADFVKLHILSLQSVP